TRGRLARGTAGHDRERVLELVEHHDLLLEQRAVVRAGGAGRGRRELRVAPDDQVGAAGETTAGDVAGGEGGGQRLAVVGTARRSTGVAAVEGVLGQRRAVEDGGVRLDVDERLALGEVLTRVDIEVVAPEDVVVVGDAEAATDEVAGG